MSAAPPVSTPSAPASSAPIPNPSAVAEKPKVTTTKTVKLTDLLKAGVKKEDHNGAATPKQEDQPFTDEQLRIVWNEYAEQRKKFQAEYQMLTQPFEKRDNQIVVSLLSPVHETMLNNIKLEFTSYLRDRLKNNLITVVGELQASSEDTRKVMYTSREKFDYLAEKNPLLKELKDRLGLDTDF